MSAFPGRLIQTHESESQVNNNNTELSLVGRRKKGLLGSRIRMPGHPGLE